ncbi:MAG: hypothetical protein ACNA7W_12785 [Pseudomonadales bacterium]
MSLLLLTAALGLGCAAVLLGIFGFIEYLQTGRWPSFSLLELGYRSRLLSAHWFLSNAWSWSLQEWLGKAPVTVVALVLAPVCWWLGARLGRR